MEELGGDGDGALEESCGVEEAEVGSYEGHDWLAGWIGEVC